MPPKRLCDELFSVWRHNRSSASRAFRTEALPESRGLAIGLFDSIYPTSRVWLALVGEDSVEHVNSQRKLGQPSYRSVVVFIKKFFKYVGCEFDMFRADSRLCKLRHTPAALFYRYNIL